MMFRTAASAVEAPVVFRDESPIPLSHLALDLPTPPIGWVAYLGNVGVEIVEDGIGRSAVSSADARLLIAEHRRNEARQAELRARQEAEAVEQDRLRRASLPTGIPAGMVP